MIAHMGKDGEDDRVLWQQVTRDVERLGAKERAVSMARPQRIRLKENRPDMADLSYLTLPEGGGIDRKTADRVKKGEMRIEARLDLHGLNIDQARSELSRFIKISQASGKRCVLVITGKGAISAGTGTIRREFPLWLEDASIRPYILSSSLAQPKHGGSGAFYIYLRKRK